MSVDEILWVDEKYQNNTIHRCQKDKKIILMILVVNHMNLKINQIKKNRKVKVMNPKLLILIEWNNTEDLLI